MYNNKKIVNIYFFAKTIYLYFFVYQQFLIITLASSKAIKLLICMLIKYIVHIDEYSSVKL